jgi:hypothetical protein
MSADKIEIAFTRENLNTYLKELAKEFRKLNGKLTPAEIILIGGAAVLAGYGFRDKTYDIDAIIHASSAMKEAINRVGDKLGLPNGWLNADFTRTSSYSDKLFEVSMYYKTFSNILTVRTVTAEYLIAMKLMSGRQYKNDLSDIAGILWEHQKRGTPITREAVDNAVDKLYGGWGDMPESTLLIVSEAFSGKDYELLYTQKRAREQEAKEILLAFEREYPDTLKSENIDAIIEKFRNKERSANSGNLTAENLTKEETTAPSMSRRTVKSTKIQQEKSRNKRYPVFPEC